MEACQTKPHNFLPLRAQAHVCGFACLSAQASAQPSAMALRPVALCALAAIALCLAGSASAACECGTRLPNGFAFFARTPGGGGVPTVAHPAAPAAQPVQTGAICSPSAGLWG